ncbi:MAG TPA: glutamate ABC transporter substrate-binding protein [Candidatus Obscuribacterales bacterium]
MRGYANKLTMLLAATIVAATTALAAHAAPAGSPSRQADPVPTATVAAADVTASLRPLSPMPQPGAMPAGSYMRRIQERGRLIVGVNQDNYRVGYLNPQTGELEGFDIEIAKLVALAIFGDETKIQYKAVVSATRIPMLQAGEVDMVVSTFTINAQRKEQILFSEVYYQAGQKVLVARDSQATGVQDLSGKRVCSPKGSTSAKQVVAMNPSVVLVESTTFTECLVLFQLDKVDAITTDDVILAGLAAQDPFRTKIVGEQFSKEPYGIGVNKEHPDFVRFINGVLQKAKADGTWKRIYNQWLGQFMGPAEPPKGTYVD